MLLIAAKLQHENLERLTLAELKCTAAEVDIAPEFVDQAIDLMMRRQTVVVEAPQPTIMRWLDQIIVANIVIVQIVIAGTAFFWMEFPFSPPVLISLALAVFAGFHVPKSKRSNQILGYALLFSVLAIAILESFTRQSFERTEITGRSLILFILEISGFFLMQAIRTRSKSKTPPTEQRIQARSAT